MYWENPYLWHQQKSTAVFASLSTSTLKDKPIKAPKTRHNLGSKEKWPVVLIRLCYLLLNFTIMCMYFEFAVTASVGQFALEDFIPEKEGILRRLLQQYSPFWSSNIEPITDREIKVRAYLTVNNFALDFSSS
jgi:hypothetical protein